MKLDKRYTITREFCGYEEKKYIVRFCGEFVNSFESKALAQKGAFEHNEIRLSNL